MTTCEYLGTTQIISAVDNYRRTYHLWGYVELGGELTAFHYNISASLVSASGVMHRSDCITEHLMTLWDACANIAAAADFDDEEVIEQELSGDSQPFPHIKAVNHDKNHSS